MYEYNMYTIEISKQDNLQQRIESNYDIWLNFAKQQEYNKLAKEIRNTRDKKLADTDWTQMQDTALSLDKQKEYQRYRQELRDITEQPDFPYNVVFPTIPGEE